MGWNPFWDRFSISIYFLFSTRYSAWNIFVAYRGYSITKYVHGWTIFYPFDQLQLPTSTWIFFTLNVDENTYFLTNYPPHLVHLVCERPHTMHCPNFFQINMISRDFSSTRCCGLQSGKKTSRNSWEIGDLVKHGVKHCFTLINGLLIVHTHATWRF